ncbi:ribosomal protein S18-alanine N-acetyltransferase [Natrialbaceae archaeon A-CW3]
MTTHGSATTRDGLSIRQAERADLLAIVRIENASFPQPWPYDAFETFLGEPGFLVAETPDTQIAGYVVSDVTPNYGRDIGHIKDVAVHPACRGDGVGSALLGRALAVLSSNGAHTVKLEVRESNDGAKRLYRRFGFDPLRRVPRYYDDGEDAIVMVRDLE